MWKKVQRTRKKGVLSSHFLESSRPSLTTVRLKVPTGDIKSKSKAILARKARTKSDIERHNAVFEQRVRVTLPAARFAIYLLDMLAKLKGDADISTNTSISSISKLSND